MRILRKKENGRLNFSFSESGIEYTFTGKIRPVLPMNANPSDTLAKLLPQGELWSALDGLWAEGLIEERQAQRWHIPYSVYDFIDREDDPSLCEALQIPKPTQLTIEARSISNVGKADFRIQVEATHSDIGPLRENDPLRSGRAFVWSENKIIPLTLEQAALFDTAQGLDVDWNSLEERMNYLASVKNAAEAAGATIDQYLEGENYDLRTEAELDLKDNGPEELQLIPKIENLDDYGFQGNSLLEGSVPAVISKPDGGFRRRRMVLAKPLRDRLEKLPKGGKVIGADVPKLLTQPEAIIPDEFDLSLFSERVKGIRTKVYNSRPYIHVGQNRGGWFEGIPGVELEDWSPAIDSTVLSENEEFEGKLKGLSEETYKELARRAKESGSEYVLHDGNWVRIDTQKADKFEKALEKFESENNLYRIPAGSILEIYENIDILEFVDKKRVQIGEELLPEDLPEISQPKWFNGQLFPYQLSGYKWLHRLSNYMTGGLLADEMGLGKTIQIIAHFIKLKEINVERPHLVIVPKTLLENWQREIDQFSSGKLACFVYGGSKRYLEPSFLKGFDVVLTTYDTLRRDQAMLATVDWNMVVCDEAQYAKNPTTQRTCAVKALKSKHRAALTGTPVENGLIEFWCIMDFVQPGLLGSWADFRREFERPIIESDENDRDAKISVLLEKVKGNYLRRMKDSVLNLPEKKIQIINAELSEIQFQLYQDIARAAKTGGRGAKLAAISKLLMLCAHPATAKNCKTNDMATEKNFPKIEKTIATLETIRELGEKAIVFTDFKTIQRVLQNSIRKRLGVWPDIINGEITSNRQRIIDIFSEKPGFNVIILGHQVAGVGLNITAANHVIHYTRPWNPAKENQATDRVHRIGQNKSVTVYYPIIRDDRFKTVEERLDELIRSKEKLARDVLRPTMEMQVKSDELFDCLDQVG
jgi:hypothetical protein